jgi:hypothetical protein
MKKELASRLQEKPRSDSELVLSYLSLHKELEYTRVGNMFILWRIMDDVLEIHDIYSEETPGAMLEFASIFVADKDVKYVEGYIDKEYSGKERSDKLLQKFGMKPYKETEEYIYYIMEK